MALFLIDYLDKHAKLGKLKAWVLEGVCWQMFWKKSRTNTKGCWQLLAAAPLVSLPGFNAV
jgi:hypothetical protein